MDTPWERIGTSLASLPGQAYLKGRWIVGARGFKPKGDWVVEPTLNGLDPWSDRMVYFQEIATSGPKRAVGSHRQERPVDRWSRVAHDGQIGKRRSLRILDRGFCPVWTALGSLPTMRKSNVWFLRACFLSLRDRDWIRAMDLGRIHQLDNRK